MNYSQIKIISIPVSNRQTAQEFYQSKLGFALLREYPMSEDIQWVQLAPSEVSSTSITLVTWFDKMPPGSVQGLVLGTNDIKADYQKLTQRGIELSPIQDASWGKSSMFNDPDGNGWVLQEFV